MPVLFVAETGRYRVWKLDAAAQGVDVQRTTPLARVLLDNLPGYPDNLMHGRDGRIWVGLFKPRNPTGAYPETTGATETAQRLYIHSLHAPAIGWLAR